MGKRDPIEWKFTLDIKTGNHANTIDPEPLRVKLFNR